MCKCSECNKKDTENCVRVVEYDGSNQRVTLLEIELVVLKENYNNLLKGMETMMLKMSSETFWKVRNVEQEKD